MSLSSDTIILIYNKIDLLFISLSLSSLGNINI